MVGDYQRNFAIPRQPPTGKHKWIGSMQMNDIRLSCQLPNAPRQAGAHLQTTDPEPAPHPFNMNRSVLVPGRYCFSQACMGDVIAKPVRMIDTKHRNLATQLRLPPRQRLHMRFNPARRGRVVLAKVEDTQVSLVLPDFSQRLPTREECWSWDVFA